MLILFLITCKTGTKNFFLSILDLNLPIGILCMKYEITFLWSISSFKSLKGLSLSDDVGNKKPLEGWRARAAPRSGASVGAGVAAWCWELHAVTKWSAVKQVLLERFLKF